MSGSTMRSNLQLPQRCTSPSVLGMTSQPGGRVSAMMAGLEQPPSHLNEKAKPGLSARAGRSRRHPLRADAALLARPQGGGPALRAVEAG